MGCFGLDTFYIFVMTAVQGAETGAVLSDHQHLGTDGLQCALIDQPHCFTCQVTTEYIPCCSVPGCLEMPSSIHSSQFCLVEGVI